MLKTNLGVINVFSDKKIYKYTAIPLVNQGKSFIVDGRYKLIIDIPESIKKFEFQCCLDDTMSRESFIDSGEDLALVSFISGKKIMSIGIEDEMEYINIEYISDGLRVIVPGNSEVKQIIIGVAWKNMINVELEGNYTWFAADPTLF
jgi:hypothetical protein